MRKGFLGVFLFGKNEFLAASCPQFPRLCFPSNRFENLNILSMQLYACFFLPSSRFGVVIFHLIRCISRRGQRPETPLVICAVSCSLFRDLIEEKTLEESLESLDREPVPFFAQLCTGPAPKTLGDVPLEAVEMGHTMTTSTASVATVQSPHPPSSPRRQSSMRRFTSRRSISSSSMTTEGQAKSALASWQTDERLEVKNQLER